MGMSGIRLALSVRQPFAEQILQGSKRFEYRSRKTHVRGRVYLYASNGRTDPGVWRKSGFRDGTLPTGVIVGSVEITGCQARRNGYAWKLEAPVRGKRRLKPRNRPQPVWFRPFG